MNKTIRHLLALALLATGSNALWAETPPEQQHSFAIYVAEGLDKRMATSSTYDWRDATPADEPVISDADVVSYDIMQHAMTLTPEAIARLPKPTAAGVAFVVVADGERIYAGVFVTCCSSRAFHVPVIMVDRQAIFPDEPANTLFIDRAYPAAWPTTRPDPRSDKRIVAALTALGKLVARGPSVDDVLTQKIGQILMDCQTIKPGMTRAELLGVFTTEGGLSTATTRTYVHRRCPYIKIDVEFTLSETDQDAVDERPADTISKVSRPYLNWSIND